VTLLTAKNEPEPKKLADVMAQVGQAPAGHVAGKAILVTLSLRKWDGKRKDKAASDELAEAKGADKRALVLEKKVIQSDLLEAILREYTQLYHQYLDRTAPWRDRGPRLLSAAGYPEFSRVVRERREKIGALVTEFVEVEYPAFWAARVQRTKLGQLYKESDLPHPSEVKAKFDVRYDVDVVPVDGDFRFTLTPEDQRLAERRTAEGLARAMESVHKRMLDVVGSMAEALRDYAPDPKDPEGKSHGFRNSLVGNVRDLVALLPSLNFTADARVDEFAARMNEKLCRVDAVALKVNPVLRDEVADEAEKMFKEMSQLFA